MLRNKNLLFTYQLKGFCIPLRFAKYSMTLVGAVHPEWDDYRTSGLVSVIPTAANENIFSYCQDSKLVIS